ncbi:MAG: histidine ammonia-lyase [Deltaproteobacteria bacterium HGW-Deltaproteobacteria-13]|jgi:histidine ammonia-lyase|nr:MAG: histidine ammonia-lyase [Deltaproteobacteria bacterium HGW-Deltaproteobacteria-13]
MKKNGNKAAVVIDGSHVSFNDIIAIARYGVPVQISKSGKFIKMMGKTQKMLMESMRKGVPVYGVTTGYGKSCGKRMPLDIALKNGVNILRFHGCGTGEPIGIEETRAAMLCRIICLARGYSGVSVALLQQLADFLNHGITPIVPCEGSVGASGDLTPMSYIGACLMGERDVIYQDKIMSAAKALKLAGLKPYRYLPKEPLAIVNGTTTMTGIAVIAVESAWRILSAAIYATALSIHALKGNARHYHPVIAQAKPFPGQAFVAARIIHLLKTKVSARHLEDDSLDTLQDPYSLRCAPQVAGVLYDGLDWIKKWVEIEANSSNDNPIFDPATGEVMMGGNFYGGHIAFAMDGLKAALASIADMCDRQIMLLVSPNLNRGLPGDLVRNTDKKTGLHHGFKAMSISSSALTAEALKATMPAASFSRSTESHNQDKVSMGTIAARDAERICTLTERVVAIHLLAAAQACDIRDNITARPLLAEIMEKIRLVSAPVLEDRAMDEDIENICMAIKYSDFFGIKQ